MSVREEIRRNKYRKYIGEELMLLINQLVRLRKNGGNYHLLL